MTSSDRQPRAIAHAFPTRTTPVTSAVVAWARPSAPEVRPFTFGLAAPEPVPAFVPEPEPVPEPISMPAPAPVVAAPPPSLPPPPAEPAYPPDELIALAKAASALMKARREILSDVEGELLQLAVDIATVLVEDEIANRPDLHRSLVRSALSSVDPDTDVRVRASRATYEGLLEAFDSATVDSGRGRVQVELDDTLEGLGVVVQAGGATIDGRVHRRLETLRRALVDARRSRDAA